MSSLSSGLPGTTTCSSKPVARVEPQIGLARLGVRSVAVVALVGKNRADVAIVRNGGRVPRTPWNTTRTISMSRMNNPAARFVVTVEHHRRYRPQEAHYPV